MTRTAPRVLAIDPSLTSTGLAFPDGTTTTLTPPKVTPVERLAWFRAKVNGLIGDQRPDVIVLEGYAYGRAQGAHQLGELGGILRLLFHDRMVPWAEVAPTVLKLYATGRGNASKPEVVAALAARSGLAFRTTDEADAWGLRALALHVYGHPVLELPKAHTARLFTKTGDPFPILPEA